MKMYLYSHPYHIVTLSPWPLLIALSILITMIGTINMYNYLSYYLMYLGVMSIWLCSYQWWRDDIRESTFQGFHTKKVYKGLKLGMFLFIISELFFLLLSFELTYILLYPQM